MKALYQRYGVILFIDGTYNVNKNKYAVYLIVVRDSHGHSQLTSSMISLLNKTSSMISPRWLRSTEPLDLTSFEQPLADSETIVNINSIATNTHPRVKPTDQNT